MAYEKNGTINHWRGFCFDIEGDPFNYQYNFTSFAGVVEEWNETFNYIDQMSQIRGKTIEMECVSEAQIAMDVPFDGQTDLQQDYGCPAYTPERFTTYAPMVYQCWYQGTQPYGSPMKFIKYLVHILCCLLADRAFVRIGS